MPYGAGDLKLEIEYQTELHGWIHCYLTYDGTRRHLYASNVFPPFPDLLDLMRAISTQRLPHSFPWDEEGRGARFEALPVAEDSPTFRLRIAYEFGEGEVWVDAELDRQAVIDVFAAALRNFVTHTSTEMQNDWKCTSEDMNRFYHLLERNYPPRSRQFGIQHFDIQVEGIGNRNLPFQLPFEWLTIEIFDIPKVVFSLDDNDIFWPYWFSLMEKIALGKLPARFQFHYQDYVFPSPETEESEQPTPAPPPDNDEVDDDDDFFEFHTITASSVKDANLFHLLVTKTNNQVTDEVLLDETFDRGWFVSQFCDEFERFLKHEYIFLVGISPFDLNTLPLERLKSLLP
jgi:hypothetical protein